MSLILSNNIMSNFDKCIIYLLKNEGGYVNDLKDPGGETNFGISKRFASEHCNDPLCQIPIKELTQEIAKKIYQKYFWDLPKLDLIKDLKLVFKIFDFGVNAGAGVSIRLLQQTYNKKFSPSCVVADGLLGKESACAINNVDNKILLNLFIDAIIQRYKEIVVKKSSSEKFLKGWITRAMFLPEL